MYEFVLYEFFIFILSLLVMFNMVLFGFVWVLMFERLNCICLLLFVLVLVVNWGLMGVGFGLVVLNVLVLICVLGIFNLVSIFFVVFIIVGGL